MAFLSSVVSLLSSPRTQEVARRGLRDMEEIDPDALPPWPAPDLVTDAGSAHPLRSILTTRETNYPGIEALLSEDARDKLPAPSPEAKGRRKGTRRERREARAKGRS